MKEKALHSKKIGIAAGVGLIVLGVPGLFLPFLQGLLFIALGLYLLSLHIPKMTAVREAVKRRVPGIKVKEEERGE